jgi:hypothetical protein
MKVVQINLGLLIVFDILSIMFGNVVFKKVSIKIAIATYCGVGGWLPSYNVA